MFHYLTYEELIQIRHAPKKKHITADNTYLTYEELILTIVMNIPILFSTYLTYEELIQSCDRDKKLVHDYYLTYEELIHCSLP